MKSAMPIPALIEEIGKEVVDEFSYEQQIVILNNLNYLPRPVFQGYCAYSEWLQEQNAAGE